MSAEELLDDYLITPSISLQNIAGRVARLEDERDRYKQHSIILNRIAWQLGVALGDIDEEEDATSFKGDAEILVNRACEIIWMYEDLCK